MDEARIEEMGSPAVGFKASREEVRFRGVTEASGLVVELDGQDEIEEIFEENNTALLRKN